jgi:hypothetical protein
VNAPEIVALASAILAAAAAALALSALARQQRRFRSLEEEVDRGRSRFAEVVAHEAEQQAGALAETLALARSEALALLAGEERRITEERRREVAQQERAANAKLNASLAEAQRSVEQRFADWGTHLSGLQQSLAVNLERVGQRQQQLTAEVESKITEEAERYQTALDEHRGRIAKLREDLERSIQELARSGSAELETHAAERRRGLQEVSDRLHRREQEIQVQIEREQTETSQRVGAQIQEIEQRQVEQLRRVVAREAQQVAVRAAQEFDTTIRAAREEASRRLSRQLDIAVERFARDAESVLSERVDSELRGVEARLKELSSRLDALSTRA